MSAEYIAHAPVRLVRDASVHGATEGHTLRVRHRTGGCRDQSQRGLLAARRERKQLAVQDVHQSVAVLHPGKLLLDSDGGYISAQSGFSGALHRRQFQHRGLHRFRMG